MSNRACSYIDVDKEPILTLELELTAATAKDGSKTGSVALANVYSTAILDMSLATQLHHWPSSLNNPSIATLHAQGLGRTAILIRTPETMRQTMTVSGRQSALDIIGTLGGAVGLLITVMTFVKQLLHKWLGLDSPA